MSPEQARGIAVDKRADIWAFGCVLYEMLTGRQAFRGETITDVLAAVVTKEPEWERVPAKMRRLLQCCLQKEPRQRLQAIGDWRLLLDDTPPPSLRATWSAAWVAAVLAVALAIVAFLHFRVSRTTPVLAPANLTMDLTPAEMLGPTRVFNRANRTALAISPNGATVIFVGVRDNTPMLYRRSLAETPAVAIPGTEGAEYPFFSPDGQWAGFAVGNKLKKVALGGGPPIDICNLTGNIWGASWGPASVIVFASQGLWTVPDSGGTPAMLLDGSRSTLVSPVILPDGQTVLFTELTSANWEDAHVDSVRLTTKQRKKLLTNATDARYSPTGHLVFMRNAALLAVPFDATRAEISGSPVPLVTDIMQATNAPNSEEETGMGQYALSGSGTLLYASGGIYPTPATTLVRVDRKGKETKLAAIKGALIGQRLSPDGGRVVASISRDGSSVSDLWAFELPAGTPTRLTSTGDAHWPLFSPDGKSITYSSENSNNPGIYSLPLNDSGTPIRIMEKAMGFFPASWSPDGKWLAYLPAGNRLQLFVRPMQNSRESRPFAASKFNTSEAEFSPAGRWIAYTSDESGAREVYVQAFPGPGEKHRISSSGGRNPAWSRDGRELFYLVPGAIPTTSNYQMNSMTAVEISNTGGSRVGAPRVLFVGPYIRTLPLRSYDVTSDGQFIMSRREGNRPDQKVSKLNVVLGWGEELKHRVPSATPAR